MIATTCLQTCAVAQKVNFAELWPLRPGNSWTILTSDAGVQETIVERDSLINGQRWFLVKGGWFANLRTGLHILGENGPELMFAYPARSGTSFVGRFGGADSILVVTNRAHVSISLGNFTCTQYRVRNKNGHTDLYYAPGVGLVRREVYRLNEGKLLLRDQWELIRCESSNCAA